MISEMTAREAIAQAIADEFGADLDKDWLARIDRILTRLYLHGFLVKPDYPDGATAAIPHP